MKSREQYNYLQLNPDEFENLTADLLRAEGFLNVQKAGQNRPGFDLFAEELIKHKTGITCLVKWAVQCKRHSANIVLADLYTVPVSEKDNATHILIVSATGFSSEAKKGIDRWKEEYSHIENTETWDAWRLSELLDKHVDITTKYFAVESMVGEIEILTSGVDRVLKSFRDIIGMNMNLLDVSLLMKIEEKANSIWVLTPTLRDDTEINTICQAVERNLQEGKSYVYFLPMGGAVTKSRHIYVNLFKKYSGRFHFVDIGSERFGYPFQITIYDPHKEHRRAFLLLESEEKKYIELRPEATTNIVKTLQERVKRELPAYLEVSKINLRGISTKRLMVVLRTIGCLYGKCTMCGFRMMSASNIFASHILKQVEHALATVEPKLPEIEHVDILGLGSFFDEREVPIPAQLSVLETIATVPSIKRITIESRAEYIVDDALNRALKAVASAELEIAIGVETSNHNIRNRVLKKGLSWDLLKAKMSLLSKYNIGIVAYVLLKPPTLNESEAVDDAIRTCRDLVDVAEETGVAIRFALEPMFVVPGTLVENLFLRGEYEPISLWSVAKIIQSIHSMGEVFVGVSSEGLISKVNVLGVDSCTVPTSCRRCRSLFLGALQEFNRTQDITIFEKIRCGFCQDGWPHD